MSRGCFGWRRLRTRIERDIIAGAPGDADAARGVATLAWARLSAEGWSPKHTAAVRAGMRKFDELLARLLATSARAATDPADGADDGAAEDEATASAAAAAGGGGGHDESEESSADHRSHRPLVARDRHAGHAGALPWSAAGRPGVAQRHVQGPKDA